MQNTYSVLGLSPFTSISVAVPWYASVTAPPDVATMSLYAVIRSTLAVGGRHLSSRARRHQQLLLLHYRAASAMSMHVRYQLADGRQRVCT